MTFAIGQYLLIVLPVDFDQRFADAQTGEIDLLKTFRALLAVVPSYAVLLQGEAFDLGTVDGYHHFRGRFSSRAVE